VSIAVTSAGTRTALRRRRDQRLVAGVAGGIADWLNAPALFVRGVLCVASGFTWTVLAGYAVLALVLPARGRRRPDWDNLVGLGRCAVIPIASKLVLGGDALGLNELFDQAPGLWVPAVGVAIVGPAVLLGANFPRAALAGPAEERAAVLAAVPLVACVGAIALGMLLAPDLRWDRAVPVAALVCGCAVVLAALRGAARPFVAPAVLAVGAAALVAAADVSLQGGIGDRTVTATGTGAFERDPHVGIGDLKLDLAAIGRRSEPVTVRPTVGSGTLRVVLPPNEPASLDARIGRGTIVTNGDLVVGFHRHVVDRDLQAYHRAKRTPAPPARIRIVARVGSGRIDVVNVDGAGP
jgi:phage shock protein PspC (stress-responsive transcriptional regulator)